MLLKKLKKLWCLTLLFLLFQPLRLHSMHHTSTDDIIDFENMFTDMPRFPNFFYTTPPESSLNSTPPQEVNDVISSHTEENQTRLEPIPMNNRWACPLCSNKFRSYHSVYTHMKDSCKKRSIIVTYPCPYSSCTYTATSYNTLYVHRTRFCKFRSESLPCVYATLGCSELFKQLRARKSHEAKCPCKKHIK